MRRVWHFKGIEDRVFRTVKGDRVSVRDGLVREALSTGPEYDSRVRVWRADREKLLRNGIDCLGHVVYVVNYGFCKALLGDGPFFVKRSDGDWDKVA